MILYSGGFHNDDEPISVSEALRKNIGDYTIYGTITSVSKLYKLISEVAIYCEKCKQPSNIKLVYPSTNVSYHDLLCSNCFTKVHKIAAYNYVSAINIELQDSESFNEIDRLSVVLFDNDTENIHVGERVLITAEVHIIQSNGKHGKLFPYYFGESIKYQDRKEMELKNSDIESIKKYIDIVGGESKVVDKLVDMFDTHTIGYRLVKEGLLLSAVNTGSNKDTETSTRHEKTTAKKRERINVLLVGDPGLAKSNLLRSAVKLVPNSRYESGENSSGKSLTAIVSKEDENYVLRSGPLVLARNAFCAINEISKIKREEQSHFLSVMEEAEFSINKHGINATIRAPTTIIASANPINAEWKNRDKIDLNEVLIDRTILDRFDLKFAFIQPKDPKEISQYAYAKSQLECKKITQYPVFLIKYIAYAKRLNPLFTEEAKIMLNEFSVSIISSGHGSYRVRETLFRLASARSRLKLKKHVDAIDAQETMQFYNMMLQQFDQVVSVTQDPRNVTVEECIAVLSGLQNGITLEELLVKVCQRNEQTSRYLGFVENNTSVLQIRNNKKTRAVYDILQNHTNIKKIQEKPVVLQWFPDNKDPRNYKVEVDFDVKNGEKNIGVRTTEVKQCDPCDPCDLDVARDKKIDQPIDSNENYESKQYTKEYTQKKEEKILKDFKNDIDFELGNISRSYWSHRSQTDTELDNGCNTTNENTKERTILYCNHCDEFTSYIEDEILKHSVNRHPRKPAFPNKQMLEQMGLKPKGNPWEK